MAVIYGAFQNRESLAEHMFSSRDFAERFAKFLVLIAYLRISCLYVDLFSLFLGEVRQFSFELSRAKVVARGICSVSIFCRYGGNNTWI